MEFREKLQEVLDLHKKAQITIDEDYEKFKNRIKLLESTKITIRGILSELYTKDILTTLAKINEKWGEPVTPALLSKVINNLLKKEGYQGGDQRVIDQKTEQLMANQQIIKNIMAELERMDIPYTLK